MSYNIKLMSLIMAVNTIVWSGHLHAGLFNFTEIASFNTAIPDGNGTFDNFPAFPTLNATTVLFRGRGPDSQEGIFSHDGNVLSTIADQNTPVPDATGNFVLFSSPSVDSAGNIAFSGNQNQGSSGQVGVYKIVNNGQLERVVDRSFSLDGEAFLSADDIHIDNGNVVFRGNNASNPIVTDIGGTLTIIADRNTAIPGGSFGNFNNFIFTDIEDETIVFGASGIGHDGIYQYSAGVLDVVADTTTAVPGGSFGNFTNLFAPVIDNDEIVFSAAGAGIEGIYRFQNGVINPIVDTNTPIPGGPGNFADFNDIRPAYENGTLAFRGIGNGGRQGLYFNNGHDTFKVIDDADTLLGKEIDAFLLSSDGLHGDTIAFSVLFNDGTGAVFTAEANIPEPSTYALIATGILALHFIKRKRQKAIQAA